MAGRQRKAKIVMVHWKDACTVTGWKAQTEPPPNCVTVGMVVADNKKFIAVAQTQDFSGENAEVTTIPRGMVEKVTHLAYATFAEE